MKKILLVILVLSLVFSSSFAFASDRCVYTLYTLFVDGQFYNEFFNAGFGYDTLIYYFLFFDDFTGGLIMKEEWKHGQRSASEFNYVKYESSKYGDFTLTFDDGSSFKGYWDKENDEDLWLCFGGDSYFRLTPVHSFDIQKDFVNK